MDATGDSPSAQAALGFTLIFIVTFGSVLMAGLVAMELIATSSDKDGHDKATRKINQVTTKMNLH